MINFLKYTLWPAVKVKLIYWWWIIKYGGKKNIPPELIFGRVSRSMERMQENLMQALRHMPADISEKEKQNLLDAIRKADSLKRAFEKAKPKK